MALAPVSSFDSFTRTVASGLGTSDFGHGWRNADDTTSSDTYLSVNTTGEAVLVVPSGTTLSKGFKSHYLKTNMGNDSVASRSNGSVVARLKFNVAADTHYAGVSLRNSGGRFIGARVAASSASLRLSLVAVDANGNLVEIDNTSTVSLQKGDALWLRFTISSAGTLTASVWKAGSAESTALILTGSYASWMTSASGFPGFFYGVSSSTASVNTTLGTLYYEILESPNLPVNAGLPISDTFTRTVLPGFGWADTGHLWYGAFADDYEAYAATGVGEATGSRAELSVSAGTTRSGFIGGSVSGKVQVSGRMRLLQASGRFGLGLHGTPSLSSGTMVVNGGYALSIGPTNAQLVSLNSSGTATTQDTYTFPFTITTGTAGTWLRFKFWIGSPTDMRAKVWVSGTAEPADWSLTYSDTVAPTYASGTPFVYATASSTASAGFHLDDYAVDTVEQHSVASLTNSGDTNVTAKIAIQRQVTATVSGESNLSATKLTATLGLQSTVSGESTMLAPITHLKAALGGLQAFCDTTATALTATLQYNIQTYLYADSQLGERMLVTSSTGTVDTIRLGISLHRLIATLSATSTQLSDLDTKTTVPVATALSGETATTALLRARWSLKPDTASASTALTATQLTNTIYLTPTSVSTSNRFDLFSASADADNSISVSKGTARGDFAASTNLTAKPTYEFKETSLRVTTFEPEKVIRAEELNTNFGKLQWVLGDRSSSAEFVVPKVLRLGRVANAVFAAPSDRTDTVYDDNGNPQGKRFTLSFNVSEVLSYDNDTQRWVTKPTQTRMNTKGTSAVSLGQSGLIYRYGKGDEQDGVVNRFATLFRVSPDEHIFLDPSVPIMDGRRKRGNNDADDDPDDQAPPGSFPIGSKVRTTDNGLWVRTGPGLSYPHIYSLPYHAVLTITGAPKQSGGYTWYPHTYVTGGTTIKGWSAGEYMEKTSGIFVGSTATATTTANPQQDSEPAYRLMYTPLETPIPLVVGKKDWSAANGQQFALPAACANARAIEVFVTIDTKQNHDARLSIYGIGRGERTGMVCAPERTEIQFYQGTVMLDTAKRIVIKSPTRIDQLDVDIVGIWH